MAEAKGAKSGHADGIDGTKDREPKVKFNQDYRKRKSKFKNLSTDEERFLKKKIEYFQKMNLDQFLLGTARPRIWHEAPPDTPPEKLSRDIIDAGLWRMDFSKKMRVFAYRKDIMFFVVSIDAQHKSG